MSYRLNLIALCAALPCGVASAGDIAGADFSLDGFGTLGVLHSDYEKADFVTSNPLHLNGVGHSRSWGTDQDSKLGVQLTAEAGRFSAVVQGITQLRYDNTFTPEVEWANVRFAVTPELSLRVGRVVLPTFLSSDTENVGYVRPWVRTPGEIRVQLPFTSSDGADVTYSFDVAGASNQVQLLVGHNRSRLPGGGVFENAGIRTLTDTIEYRHLTLHLAYQKMRYKVPPDADPYDFKAFDIGVEYDPGGWYLIAEQFNTYDEGVGNVRAYSLGGGYRIRNLTPYLVGSKVRQTSVGTFGQAPVFDQQTVAVGARWDFMKNVDLKLQYERVRIDSSITPASFVNPQPGLQVGDRAHVFSATLDFVW
ncbi:MAG: porin [Gammaproteobacteria bacterium]